MGLRSAMRVLTDDQLLAAHENAQGDVARRLRNGKTIIVGSAVRQARAAEREILSRGQFEDARNRVRKAAEKEERSYPSPIEPKYHPAFDREIRWNQRRAFFARWGTALAALWGVALGTVAVVIVIAVLEGVQS